MPHPTVAGAPPAGGVRFWEAMALNLDYSEPLRGIDGLRELVEAIRAAQPNDEDEFVEWKSHLVLREKAGCFEVARTILGMANRPVEVAARGFGGYGYLAVGVEPGNVCGVDIPDPSTWVELVEKYTKGWVAPAWHSKDVSVEGKTVLVVVVDPPALGDPPYPLRKEWDGHGSGRIFTRKRGRTVRALADDIDAISRRLSAGGRQLPDLQVEIDGDVPLPWLAAPVARENVDAWVDAEHSRRLGAAKDVERKRNQETRGTEVVSETTDSLGEAIKAGQAAMNRLHNDLQRAYPSGLLEEPDKRTLAEYESQLDDWAVEFKQAALDGLPGLYCEAGHGLVRVTVTNNSEQYLPGVVVRIHIDFEPATGFEEPPEVDAMPRGPRPFGVPKPSPLSSMAQGIAYPVIPSFNPASPRDTTIENGSINAQVLIDELRARDTHVGHDFHIYLPIRPPAGLLRGTWTATVEGRDGIVEGELVIPVREDPVDVGELLVNEL